MSAANNRHEPDQPYQVTALERGVTLALAVVIVLFVMGLLWRNQPIDNGGLVLALRILLAIMAGLLGGFMTGFLHIDYRGGGLVVRAGAGLALAVLTLWISPQVPSLNTPTQLALARYTTGDVSVALGTMNGDLMAPTALKKFASLSPDQRAKYAADWMDKSSVNTKSVGTMLGFLSDTYACMNSGACDAAPICTSIFTDSDNFLVFFDDVLTLWSQWGYRSEIERAMAVTHCSCINDLRKARYNDQPTMCAAPAKCPSVA